MRLPGITYGGVKSLGRYDRNAPMRAANAVAVAASAEAHATRAVTESLRSASDMAMSFYDANARNEADLAALDARAKLDDLMLKLDRPQYTREEVQRFGVAFRGDESVVDGYGRTRTVQRPVIPAQEVMTEAYDRAAQGIGESVEANIVNPKARAQFRGAWAKTVTTTRTRVAQREAELHFTAEKGRAIYAIEQHTREGRYPEALGRVARRVQSGLFTEEEGRDLARGIAVAGETQPVYDAIAAGDLEALNEAVARLSSDEYAGPLAPKQRAALASQARGAINRVRAETERALAERNERLASDLELSILRAEPEAGPAAIEQAFDDKVISGPTRVRLHKLYTKTQGEIVERNQQFTLVRSSVASSTPLDPTSKEHRDAVDVVWQADPTFDNALLLATKTKVLPSTAKSHMMRLGLSDDPGQVAQAATFYRALHAGRLAHTVADAPERVVARLEAVAAAQDAGMSIRDAIDLANEAMTRTSDQRSRLAATFKEHRTDQASELTSMLASDDTFDLAILGSPAPPPAMVADFNYLTERYFTLLNGDIELARGAAYRTLTSRWSSTRVTPDGDPQPMQYAPERITGQPSDVLRANLEQLLTSKGIEGARAFIMADERTRAHPQYGYAVWVLDEYDHPTLARDQDGNVVRWAPDTRVIAEEQYQRDLERARQRREEATALDPETVATPQRKIPAMHEPPSPPAAVNF